MPPAGKSITKRKAGACGCLGMEDKTDKLKELVR
jgi:hypothetical protein